MWENEAHIIKENIEQIQECIHIGSQKDPIVPLNEWNIYYMFYVSMYPPKVIKFIHVYVFSFLEALESVNMCPGPRIGNKQGYEWYDRSMPMNDCMNEWFLEPGVK